MNATASGKDIWSRRLLIGLYRAARWLSLLSCRLDVERNHIELKAPRQQCNRLLTIIWRSILVNVYWTIIPDVFLRAHKTESYADVFAMLQSASVILFAVGSFIVQVCAESRFIVILNRYIALYGRICALTQSPELFPLKFSVFYALKLLLTIGGCLYELPQLLPMRHILHGDVGHILTGIIGIYMWMGTLFMLDACFLGFLVSGVFYEQMGAHIGAMLLGMRSIDLMDDETSQTKSLPQRYSHYRRMCLLCDRADELEACGSIYSELYQVTLSFRSIFQFQIFFYIYYNFIVLLLMLYEYIWNYLDDAHEATDLVPLIMVAIKLGNIVLLIMCADYTIKKSQLPQMMPLDIVCTDIDQRWDNSVDMFLSQLQTQQLEIKVMGILQLNNEFIPTILSAIITYLFILIQFGFTGGFDVVEEIAKRNLSARN
ncbi:gustatory receptor for bitter taste 93a [Drosophila albomicans]|uniref:Gustatory receptor n=1 Tax=Drosophila albomicans TaxID=7291 RepID=A0A6P8XWA2_DROAB|nr:gustatory receptor for bitter taste 93a [Drosophila albomicans]